MQTGDTITAIASPPADAAPRGIIRLSGTGAFEILQSSLTPQASSTFRIHRVISTTSIALKSPFVSSPWESLALPCMVALYPAPQSYTAEDAVEVITVGNPHLLSRLVQLFIEKGARAADPGEFTARAYFNGRLTLAQAEGISATIAATSDAQLRAAQLLTEGKLGKICRSLCDRIARALALVEAGIDFVDQEDVVPISNGRLHDEITAVSQMIDDVTRHSVPMEQLSALPHVVIVGPPNAGKSTLFNAILDRKRAVVSATPGTTRDILAEPLHLQADDPLSPEVLLIDLAGLDPDNSSFFNPIMQQAARRAIDNADLIIQLHPADQAPAAALLQMHAIPKVPILQIRSKYDLAPAVDAQSDLIEKKAEPIYDLDVSANGGRNIAELRSLIGDRLYERTAILPADAMALEPRHRAALAEAQAQLTALAEDLYRPAQTSPDGFLENIEFTAARLRRSLDALGQITGNHITPDEVLGHIFAGFCVGK